VWIQKSLPGKDNCEYWEGKRDGKVGKNRFQENIKLGKKKKQMNFDRKKTPKHEISDHFRRLKQKN